MKWKQILFPALAMLALLLAAGCTGIPAPGEKSARHDLDIVAKQYRPDHQPPALPELTSHSSLSNYLAFALFNQPQVAAAYYDWAASVENITVTRSLPDPQFTFQAYIENSLTSLMPGLSQPIPGPGKLKARGRAAAAASRARYFAFESAVLQTAFAVKTAYYQLGLLNEQLRLKRATLALLEDSARVVCAQNTAGAATLTEGLRAQGEIDRTRNDLASLEDSQRRRLENFKAALGLKPEQPAPPVPAHFEFAVENLDENELLCFAFTHNPQLAALAAEVRTAEAGIAVAYKERIPDFNTGLMAEVYKPPFYWPQAGMTLPIWRDKLAAEVAQAEANELAAQARWQSARIELAVNFAQQSFAYRETGRNLALIENQLLPQARQSLAAIRASYRTGDVGFTGVISAGRLLLDLQLGAEEARAQRAIALAELSLMVAGVSPPGAPLLTKATPP